MKCPERGSSSVRMETDHAHSWIGSANFRRLEAAYLRDAMHELRGSLSGVHYRILYFFHGDIAVVISHGVVKEQVVPPNEIDRAVKHRKLL